jgi:outer membrane protein assembly factor BamD
MKNPQRRHALRWSVVPGLALALAAASCGARQDDIQPGALGADEFLYERGRQAMEDRKWSEARDFFTRLIDGYPSSQYRADAKLSIGDVYLEQGSGESLVLAQAEFRDFLSYYPTSPRADYAQYKLAMTHFNAMRSPGRDQTETVAAIRELELLVERYPNSEFLEEGRTRLREARDRQSESELRVGLHYLRTRWYPGAVARFRGLLESDPGFANRDAVYFYLAEAYRRALNPAEAKPYYERLIAEFEVSEFLDDARERLSEIGQGANN